MASVRPEGSGAMDDNWTPSLELLEERALLSGLLNGLADSAAAAPVEESAAAPGPPAEEPPAVVAPPPEVPASAVAAHAPASAFAAHSSGDAPAGGEGALASSPGAPVAPALVGIAEHASTPASTVGPAHAPALAIESSVAADHSTVPGASAVDSLLARAAVESQSHADSTAVEPGAAIHAPSVGSVSAHGAGPVESRMDRSGSVELELDCLPTDEQAAQPHMTADVSSSGARTAETVEQETPTIEENQSEVGEAPIERSLVQSAGDQTESGPGWVGAEHETARPLHAGEVRIAESAEAEEGLVSRVSQLFDLVPNWPGVDLDAVEDAARSVVEDGAQLGADFVEVVSTHDVSGWATATATATAGTAVGFMFAPPDLGSQLRDTAEDPADEEAELFRSVT